MHWTAAGSGPSLRWLAERGWDVTAVDIQLEDIPGVHCVQAGLENHGYRIAPGSWQLILCWLCRSPAFTGD